MKKHESVLSELPTWINSRHNPEPEAVEIHVTQYNYLRLALFFAGLAITESIVVILMWLFGFIRW